MKVRIAEIGVFLGLVALGVAGRLLPHEPNFTPVAAAALFAGFFMRHGSFAACVPLATLLISDAVLGVYDYKVMAVVYLCMLAPVLFRQVLKRRLSGWSVGLGAVSSSTLFFVATNFAVWLFSGMYARTFQGLVECYVMALPFFRGTLLGDLVWSSLLFGGYGLVVLAKKRALQARSVA